MSKCSNRILVIFVSVLFLGSLPAQEWVRDTRLLVKIQRYNEFGPQTSGSLGSKLFVYTRLDRDRDGSNLFRLEANQEFPVFTGRSASSRIHDIQVSRDDSRIVFAGSGMTWYYPTVIYSVRPDGSQLRKLVESRFDCVGAPPQYGSPYCSFARHPRLSPDGQKVIFFDEVNSFDEEKQQNISRDYLSMVPATGGPIVRLVEVPGPLAAWNEDGASIYYTSFQHGYHPWNGVLRRYDLETGRSEFLTDASWRLRSAGLAVSRADGALYFIAKQGFVRLDPETGVVEVVSEERFDTFDLSPDGRRAAGRKDGDVAIINLEFPSSSRLVIEPGVVDELELGRLPAARRKWTLQAGYAATSRRPFEVAERNGVKRVRWLDNERLWCVVQEDKSADPTRSKPEVRVGIVRLTN